MSLHKELDKKLLVSYNIYTSACITFAYCENLHNKPQNHK